MPVRVSPCLLLKFFHLQLLPVTFTHGFENDGDRLIHVFIGQGGIQKAHFIPRRCEINPFFQQALMQHGIPGDAGFEMAPDVRGSASLSKLNQNSAPVWMYCTGNSILPNRFQCLPENVPPPHQPFPSALIKKHFQCGEAGGHGYGGFRKACPPDRPVHWGRGVP